MGADVRGEGERKEKRTCSYVSDIPTKEKKYRRISLLTSVTLRNKGGRKRGGEQGERREKMLGFTTYQSVLSGAENE